MNWAERRSWEPPQEHVPKSTCSFIADAGVIGGGNLTGYSNPYSLLMDGANHYLTWTPGSSTASTKTATVYVKLRRWGFGSQQAILEAANPGVDVDKIEFTSADQIRVKLANGGDLTTVAVFRDNCKYYYIRVEFDLTNGTAADRIRVYVNGVRQSVTGTAASNNNFAYFKTTVSHRVGDSAYSAGSAWAKYHINELIIVDGSNPPASAFERIEVSTEQLLGVNYAGTFGTNGLRLRWSDATSTTTLGEDDSGNGNDWTLNSMATSDRLEDSPANTHAIWNALDNASTTISEGGLSITAGTTAAVHCTQRMTSGKWIAAANFANDLTGANFGVSLRAQIGTAFYPGDTTDTYVWRMQTTAGSRGVYNNSAQAFAVSSLASATHTMLWAIDIDAGKMWAGLYNGSATVWYDSAGGTTGDPATGANPTFTLTAGTAAYFVGGGIQNSNTITANFGQKPFAFSVPTGFKEISTANLPTPPVRRASLGFTAQLWTGNATNRAIVTDLDQVDFVWGKNRTSAGDNHYLQDSVRGFGPSKSLSSNTTAVEGGNGGSPTTQILSVSGGTVNLGTGDLNTNTYTYVGWFWKRAAQFGFDIVAYTGALTSKINNHSLNKTPDFMATKERGGTNNWVVWHRALTGMGYYLFLNSTAAEANGAPNPPYTGISTTTYTVGNDASVNNTGDTYVTYLWAAVDGFSAFPKHTGNGSADGPFVWGGICVLYDMIKRADSTGQWHIWDKSRNPFNPTDDYLAAESSAVEQNSTSNPLDLLSAGVKILMTAAQINASGGTYIHMTFGDPYKYANAA